MATSPAPDAAAPPGMCPGVAVLGGGGGAGDEDGSGDGGKDGSGGGGDGSGDGAGGDGKGAGACGSGSGAGCPNPAHGNGGKASAGDPVDVLTGRVYTIPAVDLALPGPLPLVIERSYSSTAIERDIGLGPGWSHSLAWEIEERHRKLRIWTPSGSFTEVEALAVGGFVRTPLGILTRHAWGYSLAENARSTRVFSSGEQRRRSLLSMIIDRNGNTIQLRYNRGELQTIVDSARRVVRIRRAENGRIAAFEVKSAPTQGRWTAFRHYSYDVHGDLVSASDAAGHAMTFSYEDHLLTTMSYPEGLRVSYRYDRWNRCVETWADYPGHVDASLDDGVPLLLADGVTKARGVHHCAILFGSGGYVEVADSRTVRRYFGDGHGRVEKAVLGSGLHLSSFDALGNLVSYVDPCDHTWIWDRDPAGRVVRSQDPMGAETRYTYDDLGQLIEVSGPLGQEVKYRYDGRGNLTAVSDTLGEVVSYIFDSRGLLVEARSPDGGVSRVDYDDLGGVARVHEPDGASREIRRDYLGRVVAFTDERGAETRYVYSDRRELLAVYLPGGQRVSYEYDRDGRLVGVTDAEGGRWGLCWGGLGVVHELRKPDGTRIRYRYDREGDLVKVLNERGEVHRITRDVLGRIVAEETFDGRRARYRLDALGRMVRIENGSRQATEFVYDAVGRTVARVYPDGTSDVFEYDLLGRLLLAENAGVRCTYTYDLRGRLLREAQTVNGETVAIDARYDMMDRRWEKTSSRGYIEQTSYDLQSRPTQILLGGSDAVTLQRDVAGNILERHLPGGGCIQTLVDGAGLVSRRRVLRPARDMAVRAGEPDWVGPAPQTATNEQAFRYSPSGDLIELWDGGAGRSSFSYDPLGQILARVPEHGRAELFRYDEAGALYEGGEYAVERRYERGGRLVLRGATSYIYDEDGRLVVKRRRADDMDLLTKYEWTARGLLNSVQMPNEDLVEFVYDCFARRVQKRVRAADGGVSTTRFVWDGERILHDLRERAGRSGDAIVEERTYSFLPNTFVPIAHRDTIVEADRRSNAEWVHYVTDSSTRPELLVSGSGDVLAHLPATTWGAGSTPEAARANTPIRYPGQYEDSETGICYNRHRYYDPEIGRYLSPDPIGLEGGLRPFGYADNRPSSVVDPDGLVPVTTTVTSDQEDRYGKRRSQSVDVGSASTGSDGSIHPVVKQSLAPRSDASSGPPYPGRFPPESCGEPRAISKHIEQWEKKTGRKLDPNNPNDHAEIKKCLGSVTAVRAEEPDGTKRAPCAKSWRVAHKIHPAQPSLEPAGRIQGSDRLWLSNDGHERRRGARVVGGGHRGARARSGLRGRYGDEPGSPASLP